MQLVVDAYCIRTYVGSYTLALSICLPSFQRTRRADVDAAS